MPDPSTTSSGSKSKSLPNFYSAVGGMDKYSGKPGGDSASPAKSADDSGEKVKNVTVLLEVVKKMDAAESDPENKKILEGIVQQVEMYMTKLQPGGAGAGKAGAAGAAPGGSAGGAGGAGATGATVGDTTGATAAM